MDLATLAALCSLHAQQPAANVPAGVDCAQVETKTFVQLAGVPQLVESSDAREAITRVAYAEARNQGDSGLAGVVFTILNRLADRRWGGTVDAVLNAPHQFEPVMRTGGSWRNLRPATEAERARIDAIINLALDGRLPDLTRGARYFQNPRIVAIRAASGDVPERLVNFGGATPTAVIGDHSFYAGSEIGEDGRADTRIEARAMANAGGGIFVGENRVGHAALDPLTAAATDDPMAPRAEASSPANDPVAAEASSAGPTIDTAMVQKVAQAIRPVETERSDPTRAIFVLNDGQVSGAPR